MKPFDYLVALQLPVYRDGGRLYFATDWWRALKLLRASFGEQVSRLKVVAPTRAAPHDGGHLLEPADALDIEVIPSIDDTGRAREYWMRDRRTWRRDVLNAAQGCSLGHFSCNDNIKTIGLDAFRIGLAQNLTTLFFRDVDERVRVPQSASAQGRHLTAKERAYLWLDDLVVRYCVNKADVSFLKGRSLLERYSLPGANVCGIVDTSYTSSEIAPLASIKARVRGIGQDRPLRLVYCGRLEPVKGVESSVRIVAKAVAAGARISFSIIGDGSDRPRLRRLADQLGVANQVQFLGPRVYGAGLITELSAYDALLFTPTAEETPRMIFDGYAAGLPLVGYDIPFCVERAEADEAATLIPFAEIDKSAQILCELDQNRQDLADKAVRAHRAAQQNAVDIWYKKRAEITLAAMAVKQR